MIIHRLQNGPILFVGEGNFSFSLFVAKRLTNRPCVVATSFERECQLGPEHLANAAQLGFIPGVIVRFGVDATCLHLEPEIITRQYKHVIFNFPHVGGKSKIQKNRNLLRNFFLSSSQILEKSGEVLVSLCRGQGGTAADQEAREWHNSWQVVAMAAEANLILVEVHPFDSAEFPNYTCVGFRSQDKPFCNQEALTYIFAKGQPFILTEQPFLGPLGDGKWCSAYFSEKIMMCNALKPEHPVKITLDEIIQGFRTKSNVLTIASENLPLVTDLCLCDVDCEKEGNCHHVPVYQPCSSKEDECDFKICKETNSPRTTEALTSMSDFIGGNVKKTGTLRSSVVDCLLNLLNSQQLLSNDELVVSFGPVFKNTSINEDTCPVGEEIVGFTGKPTENLKSLLRDALTDWLTLYDILFTPVEKKCGETTIEFSIEAKLQPNEEVDINNVRCLCPKSEKTRKLYKNERIRLGEVFVVAVDDMPIINGFTIDALLVSQLKFEITDWRILRSLSIRKHYCDFHENTRYISACLYPPTYLHDASFWVNEAFSQSDFYRVVRSVCGDIVQDVHLIDEYEEPTTRRVSKCFHFVYQSNTYPLSHKSASDLQLMLRSKLETLLQLELR